MEKAGFPIFYTNEHSLTYTQGSRHMSTHWQVHNQKHSMRYSDIYKHIESLSLSHFSLSVTYKAHVLKVIYKYTVIDILT